MPFGDVKIGDLGSWISRRSLRPTAVWGAIHRGRSFLFFVCEIVLSYFTVKIDAF